MDLLDQSEHWQNQHSVVWMSACLCNPRERRWVGGKRENQQKSLFARMRNTTFQNDRRILNLEEAHYHNSACTFSASANKQVWEGCHNRCGEVHEGSVVGSGGGGHHCTSSGYTGTQRTALSLILKLMLVQRAKIENYEAIIAKYTKTTFCEHTSRNISWC